MRGHLPVGVVEHDLALTRMGEHPGLEVVTHDARHCAAESLEHRDMGAQPGVLLHVRGRPGESIAAERQTGNEQIQPSLHAGVRIGQRHRRTRTVALHRQAGPMTGTLYSSYDLPLSNYQAS